jgi:prepilin-type N-terminal cleavage/methylation domain-containing protein
MSSQRGLRSRDGFSLIEVVVAMVLLAIVLTMLAAFSIGTATRLVDLSRSDVRQALTQREVSRLAALPYDSLPGAVGCRNVTVANLGHTSCVAVTTVNQERTVQLIVTPLWSGTYADTVLIQRAAAAYNPFNTQ